MLSYMLYSLLVNNFATGTLLIPYKIFSILMEYLLLSLPGSFPNGALINWAVEEDNNDNCEKIIIVYYPSCKKVPLGNCFSDQISRGLNRRAKYFNYLAVKRRVKMHEIFVFKNFYEIVSFEAGISLSSLILARLLEYIKI